jgi:hypothetical protein
VYFHKAIADLVKGEGSVSESHKANPLELQSDFLFPIANWHLNGVFPLRQSNPFKRSLSSFKMSSHQNEGPQFFQGSC